MCHYYKIFISDIFDILIIMATTIAVSPDTKENLRKFGEKGETFDQIIRRLMEDAGWKKSGCTLEQNS